MTLQRTPFVPRVAALRERFDAWLTGPGEQDVPLATELERLAYDLEEAGAAPSAVSGLRARAIQVRSFSSMDGISRAINNGLSGLYGRRGAPESQASFDRAKFAAEDIDAELAAGHSRTDRAQLRRADPEGSLATPSVPQNVRLVVRDGRAWLTTQRDMLKAIRSQTADPTDSTSDRLTVSNATLGPALRAGEQGDPAGIPEARCVGQAQNGRRLYEAPLDRLIDWARANHRVTRAE